MERLRFAVLSNGRSFARWQLDCLARLEAVADLAVVIVGQEGSAPRAAPVSLTLYARLVDPGSIEVGATQLGHVPRVAVDQLGSVEPGSWDFVLKLGAGPTPSGLEHLTRLGVWYFEHETRADRLPFLREVYDGVDITRAALLALRPDRSDPDVLEEGFFRTEQRSYRTSRDRVLAGIAAWPARATSRAGVGAARRLGASPPARPSSREPGRVRFLLYCARVTRRRLSFAWGRLFRHPQWNIGTLDAPVGSLIVPGAYDDERIEWLPQDSREAFLADPFGIVRDGSLHVLCESFRYDESLGRVCTFEIGSDGTATTPVRAIELAGHASYPFLVEGGDESPDAIYCVPETSTADELALFRADDFPHTWSKLAVLIPGLACVDPTVFRHAGSWWLFGTRRGALEDVELWIWHAPSLLGPWTEHALNPVKTDVRSARPGGPPFHHEGALYRPAQDCSRTYGWRIALQRVTRLTATEFFEEPVAVLEASPRSSFPHGRHTLTPVGDRVLVDGRRDVFVWAALLAFLKIWGADLSGRIGRGRR